MNTKSAKAKGRRLQNKVANDLREIFPDGPIKTAIMGENGADVLAGFLNGMPVISIECTNKEKIDIWRKLDQTEKNMCDALVFKRNRSKIYACILWEELLDLWKKKFIT